MGSQSGCAAQDSGAAGATRRGLAWATERESTLYKVLAVNQCRRSD